MPATFMVNTEIDMPDANPGDGIVVTASGMVSLRAVFDEVMANPNVAGTANNLPNANQYGPFGFQIEFANIHNQQFQDRTGAIITPTPTTQMVVLLESQLPTVPANLTFALHGSTSRRVTITRTIAPPEDGVPVPPTPFRYLDVAANGTLYTYGLKFVAANNVGGDGGAIANAGTLWVANSDFHNNKADQGGAIFNTGNMDIRGGLGVTGEPVGVQTLFTQNTVLGQGGAISSDAAGREVRIYDTVFDGNEAGDPLLPGSGRGGAISHTGGTMSINGAEFTFSKAGSGGAIYSFIIGAQQNPTLTIGSTLFENNYAVNGFGGALFVDKTKADFTSCSFNYNTAEKAGGAILMNRAVLTFVTSEFIGNESMTNVEAYDIARVGPPGPDAGFIYNDPETVFAHAWIDDLN